MITLQKFLQLSNQFVSSISMRLRQKKTHNLSEDSFYFHSQNQLFQTHNKKPKTTKIPLKSQSLASTSTHSCQSNYAQILARFINNINLTKNQQSMKNKIETPLKNKNLQQVCKQKRFRKASENIFFDQEKKVDHPIVSLQQKKSLNKKIKIQEKVERKCDSFSSGQPLQVLSNSLNTKKQLQEQNIINNYLIGNFSNMTDYVRFISSSIFTSNPFFINPLSPINPLFNQSNLESIPLFFQNMKSGLDRQFQIYERFKPQLCPRKFQKNSLSMTSLSTHQEKKSQKEKQFFSSSKKISPNKIFKRASYHVGIAYNIYMDSIQKEGIQIKNFSDIDPTRFAKNFKKAPQKY